jgi:hypothetical protein
MSNRIFPISGEPLLLPKLKTTHYAEGVLYDPYSQQGLPGATGIFNLWYEGTQIAINRAMVGDASLADGWVRCVIAHDEVAQRGYYRWTMTMTTADNTYTLNEKGNFSL